MAFFSRNVRQVRWIGIIVVVAAIFFNLWLLFLYRLPGKTLFWMSLQNAGHSLAFLELSLALCYAATFYFHRRLGVVALMVIGILCLLFGGMVEVVQGFVGRQSSWSDLGLDGVGTFAGLLTYGAFHFSPASRYRYIRWLLIPIALSVMSRALFTPLKYAVAEQVVRAELPLLADFDSRWLNVFVSKTSSAVLKFEAPPPEWKGHSTQVARLQIWPGSWPGIQFYGVVRDWSNYDYLVFDLFSAESENAKMYLRINDLNHNHRYSDRYNRSITVKPGYQQIRIPLGKVKAGPAEREMDMSKIKEVIFYAYRTKTARTFYLDNLRLQ